MRNNIETTNLKKSDWVLDLLFVLKKLGSFPNKESDLDFVFSNSVPSVEDFAEQTNSKQLPNITVIKKTMIFFLVNIISQNKNIILKLLFSTV